MKEKMKKRLTGCFLALVLCCIGLNFTACSTSRERYEKELIQTTQPVQVTTPRENNQGNDSDGQEPDIEPKADTKADEKDVQKESEQTKFSQSQLETETGTMDKNQSEESSLEISKPKESSSPVVSVEPDKDKLPAVSKKPVNSPVVSLNPVTKPSKKPSNTPSTEPSIKPAGTVSFGIDATVIGLGSILKETQIEVYEEDFVSDVVDRALKENGFTYNSTGTIEKNFYLSSIQKKNIVKQPNIPEQVLDILAAQGIDWNPNQYGTNRLGEFDFTIYSGWRYRVNGSYPGLGMSDMVVKPGDSIMLRYTLCLGYDADIE